ncbi:MAG: SMC-Scp complex subunit ScpB [Zavarzinella sp.]
MPDKERPESDPSTSPDDLWQIDQLDDLLQPSYEFDEPIPTDEVVPAPKIPPLDEKPLINPVPVAETPPSVERIIEAILFAGGQPVTPPELISLIRGLDATILDSMIKQLNNSYLRQNRPYRIVDTRGGLTLRILPRFSDIRDKIHGGPREARLHQNALDVLSIIAYRQPIDKPAIDKIRGTDTTNIVRQLLRLGLIRTHDRRGQMEYETTNRFLEIFHLNSLDDLPTLGEPKKVS